MSDLYNISLSELYVFNLDNLVIKNYDNTNRIYVLNSLSNHGIIDYNEHSLLKYILIQSSYDKKNNQLNVSLDDLQQYNKLKDQIKMRIKAKLDETPEQRAEKQREESERISKELEMKAAAKAAAKKAADEKSAKKEERNQYKFATGGPYVPPRRSQSYIPRSRSPSPPPSPPRQQYVPPPRQPSEQQTVSEVEGCRSYGKIPINVEDIRHFKRQSLIFHPDRNPGCKEEATVKFQELQTLLEEYQERVGQRGGRKKSMKRKSKKQQKYNKTKKLKINKKNMKK
jgi:hypothetical protein